MSLKISNKLTAKQRALLVELEYIGKFDLTVEEAAKLIDELIIDKMENGLTYGEIQNEYKHWLD